MTTGMDGQRDIQGNLIPRHNQLLLQGAGEVSSRVLGGWGLSHFPGTMRPKGKGPQVVAPESAAGRRVPRLATGKLGASSSVFPYKPFKKTRILH